MHQDALYMYRALQLAKLGLAEAMPNPSVGAVIVYKDTIIGEGYTSKYGGPHAEVNAIRSVKKPELLKESTLYVTLEPCSHYGKTPPCALLIVEKQIPKVVIGCVDPFAKVAGKGIEILQKNGIEVVTGVLEDLCKTSHQRFFTFQLKKRPFIILKWAQSIDGFIAPFSKNEKKPVWLSNTYSRQLTHKWRSEEMAILVGKRTVCDDNPSLTTRDFFGKNPIRMFLDKKGEISSNYNILSSEAPTIQFVQSKQNEKQVAIPLERVVEEICHYCYQNHIQSVIVEGGLQTLQSFIDANCWDEARIFEAPVVWNEGIPAPQLNKKIVKSILQIANDRCVIYQNITNE